MSTRAVGLALALCVTAGTARAQGDPGGPTLVFSIGAGLTTGQHLWSVAEQPLLVAPTGADTVSLQRWLTPGLVATLGVTYHPSASLGYMLEMGYFGLTGEQRCSAPPDWLPGGINQQACETAQGRKVRSSIVALQGGVTYRFAGRSAQPYVRVTVGGASIGNTFVNTTGVVSIQTVCLTPCEYPLLLEDESREFTYSGTLAAGLVFWLGPAYRLRLEARDLITGLPYATGPASPPFKAPTSVRLVHAIALSAGLDVVLERRHARRY